MATEGLEADSDDVVVTTGAQQALDLLGKIFIDPGDAIAVEAPTYVGALGAFGAYQPRYLHVEMDGDGMLVEHLEEALFRGERPKFVYTVPNFGNPAGVTMSLERDSASSPCAARSDPDRRGQSVRAAAVRGRSGSVLASRWTPENVIYLGTVSKTFSPGVRVGWALGEPSVAQRLVLAKEAADLCESNLNMLLTERWVRGRRRWRGGPREGWSPRIASPPRRDGRRDRRTIPRGRGVHGAARRLLPVGHPPAVVRHESDAGRGGGTTASPTSREPRSTRTGAGRTRCGSPSACPPRIGSARDRPG